MNKYLFRGKIIFALPLLASFACSSGKKDTAAIHETPMVVTLSRPGESANTGIAVSGQVVAAQSANISTRIMGLITSVKVKPGDRVKKGQLLATISNEDILAKRAQADAMIAEAQSAVANARKDYDRFTALYSQQSATARELDNVTLQYNAARSRLEAASQVKKEVDAMLSYTALIAPFAGIVTQKTADAGSMANPGMPLLTIENAGSYEVSAFVPENLIDRVKEGMPADIMVKSVGKSIRGIVAQVNRSSQFTGGQYNIKLTIPKDETAGLYAGMYTNANIQVGAPASTPGGMNTVLVPASALVYKDQLTGIYTVSSRNTALLRWIRTGKSFEGNVEVLSGLGPDESFILRAEGKLYNGVPVVVK
ncbi:MAG: efflux RND transporter periplasmic adaptor subunit [Sphingobacteriales bacterium]|nr:efflux RND transporter periplasmic adaptor subunit [Sphingobacteriales bacterium]OJY91111.1 MAG: efflux transporter periplasmic adaptor subunit [Sphingobacteriales bacterium 44-15]